MIVYADVLIVLNLAVDYFLLLLTDRILTASSPLWRRLLGAGIGGVSSLYIFLPQSPFILELIIRILLCGIITAVTFGFSNTKRFFRSCATFFAVSMGYAGGMMALWFILKPNGMVINNSVVYFNISPLFLIAFSVLGYFTVTIIRRFVSKNGAFAQSCTVKLCIKEKSIEIPAIADTGNSLCDPFGSSEVIIAEQSYADMLLGGDNSFEQQRRFRAIPCSTVSGEGLLDGFRCDSAIITYTGGTAKLNNPILAVSKQPLGKDYGAIINPRALQ